MIDVKIAKVEDIVAACRDAVDESVRLHPETWQQRAEGHFEKGPAYSAWGHRGGHRGCAAGAQPVRSGAQTLLGCAGLEIRREGVANAWAVVTSSVPSSRQGLPTAEALAHVEQLLWTYRNMLEILWKRYHLRTIRTFSIKGFGQSQKLLRALGFEKLRHESETRYFYRWTG